MYSNECFAAADFNGLPAKLDIKYVFDCVESSVDVISVQSTVQNCGSYGGRALVFVDG